MMELDDFDSQTTFPTDEDLAKNDGQGFQSEKRMRLTEEGNSSKLNNLFNENNIVSPLDQVMTYPVNNNLGNLPERQALEMIFHPISDWFKESADAEMQIDLSLA